jgi:hypothetical protein
MSLPPFPSGYRASGGDMLAASAFEWLRDLTTASNRSSHLRSKVEVAS